MHSQNGGGFQKGSGVASSATRTDRVNRHVAQLKVTMVAEGTTSSALCDSHTGAGHCKRKNNDASRWLTGERVRTRRDCVALRIDMELFALRRSHRHGEAMANLSTSQESRSCTGVHGDGGMCQRVRIRASGIT